MVDGDKVAGVIGGMGPAATIDFMSRVLHATPAGNDQQHVRMLVDHNPRIPSRQLAIRGEGESPGPTLAAMARRLQVAGADFLLMPCNLAHAWQTDIEAATEIPFLSIVDLSVQAALLRSGEQNPIGLLTTPGCFTAGLYQRALADSDRPLVLQTDEELTAMMTLVERIKNGDLSADIGAAIRIEANKLVDRGAKLLIAACTELPLVLNESMLDVALVSSTDELAKKTVAVALGKP